MHSQLKQWHRTKKIAQFSKDWKKQRLVHFTSICCFWPAIYQSLLWSWPDERGVRRDDFWWFTLRRCYIWVHHSFLWFTAGSLDTSDALSRTFCATYSQDRIRFRKAKQVYLMFLAGHLPIASDPGRTGEENERTFLNLHSDAVIFEFIPFSSGLLLEV